MYHNADGRINSGDDASTSDGELPFSNPRVYETRTCTTGIESTWVNLVSSRSLEGSIAGHCVDEYSARNYCSLAASTARPGGQYATLSRAFSSFHVEYSTADNKFNRYAFRQEAQLGRTVSPQYIRQKTAIWGAVAAKPEVEIWRRPKK